MKEKFTFFWGGHFSNFYPAFFEDDLGIVYSCSEQYYMSKKALFFNDTHNYSMIIKEKNPKKQKKYGRKVEGFDESIWYGENCPAKKFMREGCYYKFTQNLKLKEILLATEGTTLVEASPYDLTWGIGAKADSLGASNRRFWAGKNWLGDILTDIRKEIIKSENMLF